MFRSNTKAYQSKLASIETKQVVPQTLFLESPTLKKPLVLDLTEGASALATRFKKNPLVIKEVRRAFRVYQIVRH